MGKLLYVEATASVDFQEMHSSEEMSDVSESLIFGQKTSDLLGNQMSEFPALKEGKKNTYV